MAKPKLGVSWDPQKNGNIKYEYRSAKPKPAAPMSTQVRIDDQRHTVSFLPSVQREPWIRVVDPRGTSWSFRPDELFDPDGERRYEAVIGVIDPDDLTDLYFAFIAWAEAQGVVLADG